MNLITQIHLFHIEEYYLMIQQHGAEEIKDNLQNWLDETSELGCGDDITLLLAYSQV